MIKLVELEKDVKNTIRLIRKYLANPSRDLSDKIVSRLSKYANDKKIKTWFIENPHILKEFLECLNKYIKVKHEIIESRIISEIELFLSPSIYSKLIYDAAKVGNFIIPDKPGAFSLTIYSIKDSLERLPRRSRSNVQDIEEGVNKIISLEYLIELLKKKKLLESISKEIVKEVKRGESMSIDFLLKLDGRPVGFLERRLRAIALISLMINGVLKLKKDKDEYVVERNG